MATYAEISTDICFTQSGYSGELSADDVFLGYGNTLPVNPIIKLEAVFQSEDHCVAFLDWWRDEISNGVDTFLIYANLFSTLSLYGVRQIKPITHTSKDGIPKIKWEVEVLFDQNSVDNVIPSATPLTVYVNQDSSDNFILLSGEDVDNDALSYDVVTAPSKGVLAGMAPQLTYTPDSGVLGDDSFTFTTSDRWSTSNPAICNIVIGIKEHTDYKMRYEVTAPIRVSGNFHYDAGTGLIVSGNSGYIAPDPQTLTFASRTTTATYIDEDGVLQYAAINEARYVNNALIFEEESTNEIIQSSDMRDALSSWDSTGGSLVVSDTQFGTDETNFCSVFTEASDSGKHGFSQTLTTVETNDRVSAQIKMKRGNGGNGSRAYGVIELQGMDGVLDRAYFDLDTGVIDLVENDNMNSVATITALTDGWYLCTLSTENIRYGISYDAKMNVYMARSTAENLIYNGNGSASLFVEHAQVEIDSEYTSYIPTTTVAVTRAEDLYGGVITIYSDDHNTDIRDADFITNIIIDNWGTRANFTEMLRGMTNIQALSFSEDAGICRGTDFSGMFWGCGLEYLQAFNTSYGISFSDMFRESTIDSLPSLDYANGIYFQRMFLDADTTVVRVMNTTKGQYFQQMFMNCTLMECIGGIDTRQYINTSDMFYNTPLLAVAEGNEPDEADKTVIEAGALWTKATPCRMTIDAIIQNTVATCNIDTIDASCTSSTTYTVDYSGELALPTNFAWTVVNGTISAGQGTDTVTVYTTSATAKEISVSCAVTDSGVVVNSGTYNFTHQRTYGYLTLDIPKQYAELDLRAYIDGKNPDNKTEILLLNSVVNCSMKTGDLTGLTVEFRNTGAIQGFTAGHANASLTKHNGLNITTPIKLINTGQIRGCGGSGGTGGKGANDTYVTNEKELESPSWTEAGSIDRVCWGTNHFSWNGTQISVLRASNLSRLPVGYGPMTIGGVANIYKGDYRWSGVESPSGDACDGTTIYGHNTERRYTVTHSRTGGVGGIGGYGAAYLQDDAYASAWRTGDDGGLSSPTGGYSGGDGGHGGWWGNTGSTGDRGDGNGDYGTAGYTAGKGITGSSLLSGGSITGTVSGGIS